MAFILASPDDQTGCAGPPLIADLTVVEVHDGPHNVGWTFPDQVNKALLDFLAS